MDVRGTGYGNGTGSESCFVVSFLINNVERMNAVAGELVICYY
jgi:hypothetical protein